MSEESPRTKGRSEDSSKKDISATPESILTGGYVADSKQGKKGKRQKRFTVLDFKKLEPWQRRRVVGWILGTFIIAVAILAATCIYLHNAGEEEESSWWDPNAAWVVDALDDAESKASSYGATEVTVGSYVDNVTDVSIKNSSYSVTMEVWFKWDGRPDLDMAHNFGVYKGKVNSREVLVDVTEGTTRYQLVRTSVTASKVFYTTRFPLGKHQLRLYLESDYGARDVIFNVDRGNCSINDSARTAGFVVTGVDWGEAAYTYPNTEGNPTLSEPTTLSEMVTAINLERDGLGLYLKCFIAMYGTSLWCLIMLYICGHHRVDPLGMIPAALFGTVSNIMVGAALLPDALDAGLLEFVNCWGILTILLCAGTIIQVNNIRSEHGRKDERFAGFFGRAMFYSIAFLAVVGNIALPLSAVL